MTRRDFELIAATLRKRVEHWQSQWADAVNGSASAANNLAEVRAVANDFARELTATNPRFNAAQFLEACGL